MSSGTRSASIIPTPSAVTPASSSAVCALVEYGDSTDMMGGGRGHFNAFQKQRLGWLDYDVSPPITTVAEQRHLHHRRLRVPGTGPKALKIARGPTGQSFFVEFRRNDLGFDTALYRTGVFVHLAAVTADPTAATSST